MKKSLIISENEKYGRNDSPAVATDENAKAKPRKFAPTITLSGSQVKAFCGDCNLKVGDKGSATVHYIVKAASAGDQYGEDVPSKKGDQKLTLSLTHVEADDKKGGEDDDEEEDNSEEEKSETPAEEEAEGEDDADESGEGAPADKLSPKDAGLED